MNNGSAHISLGITGEKIAASYLESKNFRILERNWRHKHLELDIIGAKNNEIYFFEIKTRTAKSLDQGFGAINKSKISKLFKGAQHWLLATGYWNLPCHFDIICLYLLRNNFYIRHFKDALDATMLMDSSNTNWQPW